MGFLKLIGAVSAAEHSKLDAKFKKAIGDLARTTEARAKTESDNVTLRHNATLDREAIEKQAAKIEQMTADLAEDADDFKTLKVDYDALWVKYSDAMKELAALRPDAQKWRDRAARELQRGQAKRDAAGKAVAAKGRGK